MTPAAPTPDDLRVQSRALGDRTRYAVFAHLRDARHPLTVAELTEHFGLNHNAIRQHLAKLVEADLIVGEQHRTPGAGRPPVRYRPRPGAVERLGGSGPFEALAALLVQLLKGEGTPREVGRRAGHVLAVEHAHAGDAVAVLESVARRLGFEPHLEPHLELADGADIAGDATGADPDVVLDTDTDVVLDRCPFLGPAAAAPEIICDLHLGIAEGIAEATPGVVAITGLAVRPPAIAGCRIGVATAS